MVYIRQHQLPTLKSYRYAGVDHSLVSRYILKPFYNKYVIQCFPMGMAPNAITLSGFFFVILNFFTMLWYNPTLDQDCPSWVYASWALGLWLYQTFDAVDGMQARRTKQSGPLGELFDHSVDACNTGLGVLIFAAAMNLGQSWATVLTLFGSTMTFYVQTWDEYFTEVLTLGIVSGPVEGVLTLCVVFAYTAYAGGGSFWHRPMMETVGIPKLGVIPDNLYNLPFTGWYIIYGACMLFFAAGSSIIHVLSIRRQRGLDALKPLYGLLPLIAIWTLIPAYLYLHPVVLKEHLVAFTLFAGLINAYSVGRIIVAHLVKTEFPYCNVLLLPLALAVLDSVASACGLWTSVIGDGFGQVVFVYLCLGFAVGVYGTFMYDIITTICDYIDIWCLTIKHPFPREVHEQKGDAGRVVNKME